MQAKPAATGDGAPGMVPLGILQYVSPSILFMLSVMVFKEPLQVPRLIGFALTWGALVVYSLEGLFNNRRAKLARVATAT